MPHDPVSAPPFILVMPLPMLMLARFGQPVKAPSPTLVTESGMVTLVMLLRLVVLLGPVGITKENAASPMLVTGEPAMVLGMTTSPPGADITGDGDRAVSVGVGEILRLDFSKQRKG